MGMYDNNPQARNTCSNCGAETEPWRDICLACEMRYEQEQEKEREKRNGGQKNDDEAF